MKSNAKRGRRRRASRRKSSIDAILSKTAMGRVSVSPPNRRKSFGPGDQELAEPVLLEDQSPQSEPAQPFSQDVRLGSERSAASHCIKVSYAEVAVACCVSAPKFGTIAAMPLSAAHRSNGLVQTALAFRPFCHVSMLARAPISQSSKAQQVERIEYR